MAVNPATGLPSGTGGLARPRPDQVNAGQPSGAVVAPGSSNVVRARLVIVFGPSGTPEGVFVYTPGTTPGPGNPPIAALTNQNTDPFGNAIHPEIFSQGAAGTTQAGLQAWLQDGSLNMSFLANAGGLGGPGATTAAALAMGIPLDANTSPSLTLGGLSARSPADGIVPTIRLLGFSANGTAKAYILVQNSDASVCPVSIQALGFPEQASAPVMPGGFPAGPVLWGDSHGSLERLAPSGRTAVLSDGSTNAASNTVTQATFTQLTASWGVPANDPNPGTLYRLTCFGNGTWGSTQQQLTMRGNYTAGPGLGAVRVASTFIPASGHFDWSFTQHLLFSASGAGGAWIASATLAINDSDNPNTPGVAASNAMALCGAGSGSLSTTSAFNVFAEAEWASTTGAPTITCTGSLFERVGA